MSGVRQTNDESPERISVVILGDGGVYDTLFRQREGSWL
jgi:hypothetical protein